MSTLKDVFVNIPLVEALEQMPRYAKFLNDLVTKKQIVSFKTTNNMHYYSVIASQSFIQKKKVPGDFTIRCTIRSFNFS